MEKIMPDDVLKDVMHHSVMEHNIFIVWRPEYDLGIPIIDEQHRGIVSTINSLYFGMQNKHGESMLAPIIGMVREYTRIHFDIEEDFQRKCEYPMASHHSKLHNELTKTLSTIGKDSISHRDPYEFMEFLKKWWIDHICHKDRDFLNFFRDTQNI